jgi:hypothetical protein
MDREAIMDPGLLFLLATVGCGLIGLGLLSLDWVGPMVEGWRLRRLYEAEELVKQLVLRGSPATAEAAADGIRPLPNGLDTYEAGAVVDAIERAKLSPLESAALAKTVRAARHLADRIRISRERAGDGELTRELLELLREARMADVFASASPRRFRYSIAGSILTAVAILLAIPSYMVAGQESAADKTAIRKLKNEALSADARTRLATALRADPSSVEIVYVPMLGEGYGRQLREAFDDAGWKVIVSQSIFGGDDSGIAVILNMPSREDADTVAAALKSIDADCVVHYDVGATKVQELDLKLPARTGTDA